jgi:adenosine deaminase
VITAEQVRELPKAEVHVHLEGCFEPADVEALARAAGEPVCHLDVTGSDLTAFL